MKKFKKIYIEITNVCNLCCDFCPQTTRKPKFMDKELFELILNKVKNNSEHLYFHVLGEPLLHPEISLFLDMCNKYGFKVNITTNGTLIKNVGDSIISKPALRQINFSLHSFEANDNDYLMNDYLENIFSFIKESIIENKLYISLRLWNLSEIGKNQKNDEIFEWLEEKFSLDFSVKEKLTHINSLKLAPNIYLNQASKFEWPDLKNEKCDFSGYCYGLRDQLAILVDGTVVPCCLDSEGTINLGSIKTSSLESIINSERAVQIYNNFSNKKVVEELCSKCSYRTRFNN